nr:DUF3662 and FHA domain-containing protein [Lolliginicoccus lacisalsi]
MLDRFERRLEEAVGDAFARLFRSAVVPQEIQAALRRAAEDGVTELEGGYLLAPNSFTVTIGASDHERLIADRELTERVFARHLGEYITEQGWQTCAGVRVRFSPSEEMHTGQFRAAGHTDPDIDSPEAHGSVWPMPAAEPTHDEQEPGGESMSPQSDVMRGLGRNLFGTRRGRPHKDTGVPSSYRRSSDQAASDMYPSPGNEATGFDDSSYDDSSYDDSSYDDADFAEETYFDQTAIAQPPRSRAAYSHRTLTAVLELSDGSGRSLTLRPGATVIGRGQEAQFRVPDTGVSRRHAEIRWDGQLALVSDLRSTNGTTVNGSPSTVWQLADGDVIRVGHSEMIVRFG